MTHLFVDAGNTRLKWRARSDDGQRFSGAGMLDASNLFEGLPAAPVRAVDVTTVIAESEREGLAAELRERFGVAPAFRWTQSSECGVRCGYAAPETMGADRWHALIGAWLEARDALLVIDAGSALTIDVLDRRGMHQGGFILPGHRLMRESLEMQTARVKFGKELSRDIRPGLSTDACVRNGLSWLWSALIDRVESLRDQYGAKTVFVTGGDGEGLIHLGLKALYRPELVLDGLEAVVRESGRL